MSNLFGSFFHVAEPEAEAAITAVELQDHEVAHHESELASELSEITTEIAQFQIVHDRFGKVNDVYNYLEKTPHKGEDATRNARALLAMALEGVEAEEDQAALEADAEGSIALEVFKSARDNIKKFIAWIVQKYNSMKKRVTEFFQKYLGSIERMEKGVQKRSEKLSEMSGWSLKEKADKVDISSYVTSLARMGKPVKSVKEIQDGVSDLTDLVTNYGKYIVGKDSTKEVAAFAKAVKAMKSDDFDGSVMPSAAVIMQSTHQRFEKLASTLKMLGHQGDNRFGRQKVRALKQGLLGNANVFVATPVAQADEANAINLGAIRVMGFSEKAQSGKMPKAELKIASVSELEALNNGLVANLSALKDLVRGQQREAFNNEVANIYDAVKGIEKAIGNENYTAEVRSSVSKIDSVANRMNELGQNAVLSISSVNRSAIAAADRFIGACVSNYEKPKEA